MSISGKKKLRLITGVLSVVSFLSVCAVGYSTWAFSGGNTQVSVPTTVASTKNFSYGKTVYYINGSESGFEYYVYDNQYYFTSTSYSLEFKVSPVLLLSTFANGGEILLNFSISYTSDSFDMFSNSNSNATVPSRVRYHLKNEKSISMTSMPIEYSIDSNTRTLASSIYLYSDTMPSLYSMTKNYSTSSTTYVYLWASFDFELKDGFSGTSFENISMKMTTSVNGAAS